MTLTIQVDLTPEKLVHVLEVILGRGGENISPSGSMSGTSRGWTREMIGVLKREVKAGGARNLLQLTADKAGQWISMPDVVQASAPKSHNQVRGDLSGLTKLIRGRFGKDQRWPVEFQQGMAGVEALAYRMDPIVAGWWNEG